MNAMSLTTPEIMLFESKIFEGIEECFTSLNQAIFEAVNGRAAVFVQGNCSHLVKNLLSGSHYQIQQPKGKLVCVVQGEVFA